MLKNLDYLGQKITLYHQNNQCVKTSFGGLITLFLGILLILLVIEFGNNFYRRTDPAIIKSTEILNSTLNNTVDNKNFSIELALESSSMTPVDPELFEIAGIYYSNKVNKDKMTLEKVFQDYLTLKDCNLDYYSNNPLFNNKKILCPDLHDLKIGNTEDYDNTVFFQFLVYGCKYGELSSRGLPCLSNKEREKYIFLEGLQLNLYYPKILINPKDYDNGFIKTVEVKNNEISINCKKNMIFILKNLNLKLIMDG